MDIEGLGEAMVEQLVGRGLVRKLAILWPNDSRNSPAWNEWARRKRLGQSPPGTRPQPPATALAPALWSWDFACRVVARPAPVVCVSKSRRFDGGNRRWVERIPDVGEVVGEHCAVFQEKHNREMIAKLRTAGLRLTNEAKPKRASDSKISGTTWVITGTLSRPRDEITELIIRHGGKISGSVSKKASFVFAGEEAGSKLEKAKKTWAESDWRRRVSEVAWEAELAQRGKYRITFGSGERAA